MKFKKFFDAFPPPKFLNVPYAGLSISDSAIRCIQFGKKGGNLYIEKYTERVIAPGVITSGNINNAEEMTHMLETLKKDLNLGYVKVSLPEEKAYLFTTIIPVVETDGARGAVEATIEESVPVSPAELLFDYRIIPHPEKNHLDVVVSALPIAFIDTYVAMLQGVGLSPLALEIESQSVARALLPKGNIGTVVVAHFGREKVALYVVSGRVIHFTTTLPLKGEMETNLSFLSQEIKKLFIYWHTLKDNLDKPERLISQIIVCGENASDDIVAYLSANSKSPVTLGNVWANVFDLSKVVPPISLEDSLRYATAIGLALPSRTLI